MVVRAGIDKNGKHFVSCEITPQLASLVEAKTQEVFSVYRIPAFYEEKQMAPLAVKNPFSENLEEKPRIIDEKEPVSVPSAVDVYDFSEGSLSEQGNVFFCWIPVNLFEGVLPGDRVFIQDRDRFVYCAQILNQTDQASLVVCDSQPTTKGIVLRVSKDLTKPYKDKEVFSFRKGQLEMTVLSEEKTSYLVAVKDSSCEEKEQKQQKIQAVKAFFTEPYLLSREEAKRNPKSYEIFVEKVGYSSARIFSETDYEEEKKHFQDKGVGSAEKRAPYVKKYEETNTDKEVVERAVLNLKLRLFSLQGNCSCQNTALTRGLRSREAIDAQFLEKEISVIARDELSLRVSDCLQAIQRQKQQHTEVCQMQKGISLVLQSILCNVDTERRYLLNLAKKLYPDVQFDAEDIDNLIRCLRDQIAGERMSEPQRWQHIEQDEPEILDDFWMTFFYGQDRESILHANNLTKGRFDQMMLGHQGKAEEYIDILVFQKRVKQASKSLLEKEIDGLRDPRRGLDLYMEYQIKRFSEETIPSLEKLFSFSRLEILSIFLKSIHPDLLDFFQKMLGGIPLHKAFKPIKDELPIVQFLQKHFFSFLEEKKVFAVFDQSSRESKDRQDDIFLYLEKAKLFHHFTDNLIHELELEKERLSEKEKPHLECGFPQESMFSSKSVYFSRFKRREILDVIFDLQIIQRKLFILENLRKAKPQIRFQGDLHKDAAKLERMLKDEDGKGF